MKVKTRSFFGAVSEKEKEISSRYRGRRTEIYCPGFRENRSSQRTLDDFCHENGEIPSPPNLLDEKLPHVYRLFNSPNSARKGRLYKAVDGATLATSTDYQDVATFASEGIHNVSPCSTDTSFDENSQSEQLENTFYNLSIQAERGSEIIDESIFSVQNSYEIIEIEEDNSKEKQITNSLSNPSIETNEIVPKSLETTQSGNLRPFYEESDSDSLVLRLSSVDSARSEAVKLEQQSKIFPDSLEELPCQNSSEEHSILRSKDKDEIFTSSRLGSSSSDFKLVCDSLSSLSSFDPMKGSSSSTNDPMSSASSLGPLKESSSSENETKSEEASKNEDISINETIDEIEENLPRDSLDSSSKFNTSLSNEMNTISNEIRIEDKMIEAGNPIEEKSYGNVLRHDTSFANTESTIEIDLKREENESIEMVENSFRDSLDESLKDDAVPVCEATKSSNDMPVKRNTFNENKINNLQLLNYLQTVDIEQQARPFIEAENIVPVQDMNINLFPDLNFCKDGNVISEENKELNNIKIFSGPLDTFTYKPEFVAAKTNLEHESECKEFLVNDTAKDLVLSLFSDSLEGSRCFAAEDNIEEKSSYFKNQDLKVEISTVNSLESSSSDIRLMSESESCQSPSKVVISSDSETKLDKIKIEEDNAENEARDEIQELFLRDCSVDDLKCEKLNPNEINIDGNGCHVIADQLSVKQNEVITSKKINISDQSLLMTNLEENTSANKTESELERSTEMNDLQEEISPQRVNESCSEISSRGFTSSSESSGSSIMITSNELSQFSEMDESTSWVYSNAYSSEMKDEMVECEQQKDISVISEEDTYEIDNQTCGKAHSPDEKCLPVKEYSTHPVVSNLVSTFEDINTESNHINAVNHSANPDLESKDEKANKTLTVEDGVNAVNVASKCKESFETTVSLDTLSTSYTSDSVDKNERSKEKTPESLSGSNVIICELSSINNGPNIEEKSLSKTGEFEKEELLNSISEGLDNLHLMPEQMHKQLTTDMEYEPNSIKDENNISVNVNVIPQTPSKFKFVSIRSGKSSDKKKPHKQPESAEQLSEPPLLTRLDSLSSISSVTSTKDISELNIHHQKCPSKASEITSEMNKENSEPPTDFSQISYPSPGKFCYTSTPKQKLLIKSTPKKASDLSSTHSVSSTNKSTTGNQKIILKKIQIPVLPAYKKPKLDNIESPVAKYINEYPTSPLIKNVKCKTSKNLSSIASKSKIPLPPVAPRTRSQQAEKSRNISKEGSCNSTTKSKSTPKTGSTPNSTISNTSKSKSDTTELKTPKARRELETLMQQEKSTEVTENQSKPVLPIKTYTGTSGSSLTPERLDEISKFHLSNKKQKSNRGLPVRPQSTIIKHRRVNAIQWANEQLSETTHSSPTHVATIAKSVKPQKSDDESLMNATGQDMELSIMEIHQPVWTKSLSHF